MSDFLAEQVDRHTDDMPSNKKLLAIIIVALIAFFSIRSM